MDGKKGRAVGHHRWLGWVSTIVCMLGNAALASAAELRVDVGLSGQSVQSGWTEWSVTGTSTADASYTKAFSEFGGFTAVLNSDDADLTSASSSNASFDPLLNNVVNDMLIEGANSNNQQFAISLLLTGLDAGSYSMTSYHHRQDRTSARGTINIFVDGVQKVTAAPQTYANSASLAPSSFDFVADGVNPVLIELGLNTASAASSEVYLNGFVLVPEPMSAMVLVGTAFLLTGRRCRRA